MKTNAPDNNYKIYATVLLCATIFWFMAKLSKKYDHMVDIPLNVSIENEAYILKYPAPELVRVNLTGRGFDMLQLPFYQVSFDIHLTRPEDGRTINLANRRELVTLPEDLTLGVKSIVTPHQVTFELDERVSRKIPVAVRSNVRTAAGYTLVASVAEPESLEVMGPATLLDTLQYIRTLPKDYEEVNLAFRDRLEIEGNNKYFMAFAPKEVDIFFDVQRLAEKELANIPVEVINVPAQFEVVPLPSFVRVYTKGGEKILANSQDKDFRVVIDFARHWQPGLKRVKANIETDLNIRHVESIPPNFELIVQKKRKGTE